MNRFETMTHFLNKQKLFKLVCGAGNEDAEEVRRLVFTYTLSGAKCFDISADVKVVEHAGLGIKEATEYASKLGREITIKPFVNVSIGMRGDPHARKAKITDSCIKCGICIDECRRGAIFKDFVVVEQRCIGCGDCEAACNNDAIVFYHKDKNLKDLLMKCKDAGMEQMELHAAVFNSGTILEEWQMINDVVSDNYVSMCLDRLHLGDSFLKRRIKEAKEIANDRFIVQADGVPMSGGSDDYNTTLQAVAIADIIMKSKLDVKVLLSGGTNSLTAQLARQCNVDFNGVAIGTFARKLVKDLIQDSDYLSNDEKVAAAVKISDDLVRKNIGDPIW